MLNIGKRGYLFRKKKAASGPPVSDGLVIHLDASDPNSYSGSGTTWTDLSGYGNDFTAQSSTNVTYNSTYKYFTLNGSTNSYFSGPAANSSSLSSVNTYFTFFLICKPTTGIQNPFSFHWPGATGSLRNISCHVPWSNVIYFDVNGCCAADQRIAYSTNVATQIASAAVWGFRSRDPTTPRRQIFYNNVSQVDSGANSTNTGWESTSTSLTLGTYAPSPSYYWQTRLWGFLLYNRGLTDAEMSDMQDYFDSHYDGLLV